MAGAAVAVVGILIGEDVVIRSGQSRRVELGAGGAGGAGANDGPSVLEVCTSQRIPVQPRPRLSRTDFNPLSPSRSIFMSDDTVEDDNAGSVKSDIEALKDDLIAIRADLAALLLSSTRAASVEARRQAERVGEMAEDVAMTAEDYRAMLEEKVRTHPLAAVGIALAVGMLVTSISRQR
jgi:ElaB/YqjD/DUF883 family membrane-anchored ribosome-binding protein